MDTKFMNAILLWKFDDAPEEYKLLSTHGGDENYVAFIPDSFIDPNDCLSHEYNWESNNYDGKEFPYIYLLENSNGFSSMDIDHFKVAGGWIFIGAH